MGCLARLGLKNSHVSTQLSLLYQLKLALEPLSLQLLSTWLFGASTMAAKRWSCPLPALFDLASAT
jgi:hypothetical protein